MSERTPFRSRYAMGRLLAIGLAGHTQLAEAQYHSVAPDSATRSTAATPDAPHSSAQTGVVVVASASSTQLTVVVDGRAVGPSPQRLELLPGMHEITGIGKSVDVYPVRVLVEAKKTISIGLNAVPKLASFEIDPVAPDAVLIVDQKPLGSGKRTVSWTPGYHELVLQRAGYESQRLSVTVQPGQKAQLKAAPYVASAVGPAPRAPSAAPSTAVPPATAEPLSAPKQPPPLDAKANEAPPSPYTGIFGSLVVPVMLGGKSTHSYVDDCPAKTYGGACAASAPRGGGLALRLGYVYEWLGIELVGAGAVDVTSTELKLPPIPTISSTMQDAAGRNVFVRAGVMYGIGARLAIPMQGIRITVGADYLFIHRKIYAIPDSFAGANLAYTVPGWFIDGGIQLGSTPGARFYIGAFALIEQAHDLPLDRNLAALGLDPSMVPETLTHMTIYRGRQVFYGPLLGIAFGH